MRRRIDVEAKDREVPRHIDGQRQPDIAEADDADAHVLKRGRPGLPGSLSRCRLNLVVHRQVLSSLDIVSWLSISREFRKVRDATAGPSEFVLAP